MVRKSNKKKEDELKTSLDVIDIALAQALNTNNPSKIKTHTMSMLPHLRQLIASNGRNFRPRLLDYADDMSQPLKFYADQEWGIAFTVEFKLPNQKETVFAPTFFAPNFVFQKTWSPFPKLGLCAVQLREWMKRTVFYNPNCECKYTRNKLLRAVADKDGGGHFDDLQDQFSFFLEQRFLCLDRNDPSFCQSAKDIFVLDLGALVSWLGKRLFLALEQRDHNPSSDLEQEIERIDRSYDELKVQYTQRFGWVVPSSNSWGIEIPSENYCQLRVKFSRNERWFEEPHVYFENPQYD